MDVPNCHWEDLAGDGNSRLGLLGNPDYQAAIGITGVMQQYNSFNEETDVYMNKGRLFRGKEAKTQILNDWLIDNNFTEIPGFDVTNAERNSAPIYGLIAGILLSQASTVLKNAFLRTRLCKV